MTQDCNEKRFEDIPKKSEALSHLHKVNDFDIGKVTSRE